MPEPSLEGLSTTQSKVAWRLIDVLISVTLGVFCFMARDISLMVRKNQDCITTLQDRLTRVEATRFTAKDGLDVWREIGSIRAELAKHEGDNTP